MSTSDDPPSSSSSSSSPTLTSYITYHLTRFSHNISDTFSTASPSDYIRLIAIVGGYLLLRPYLQKLGAKLQEKDHARASAEGQEEQDSAMAAVESSRGRIQVVGPDDVDEDEDGYDDGDDDGWGKKKRIQQRRERARVKKDIEEREMLKAGFDDKDDKDIQEFLED